MVFMVESGNTSPLILTFCVDQFETKINKFGVKKVIMKIHKFDVKKRELHYINRDI